MALNWDILWWGCRGEFGGRGVRGGWLDEINEERDATMAHGWKHDTDTANEGDVGCGAVGWLYCWAGMHGGVGEAHVKVKWGFSLTVFQDFVFARKEVETNA